MRTTIDIPEDLYRTLKARAGLRGMTLRELVQRLIEQGLRGSLGEACSRKSSPPPVIIAPQGTPIRALTHKELARIEEEEDEAKHARPA